MQRYVVISSHPPNSCPSSNKALKERSKNMNEDLNSFFRKYEIKPNMVVHLDPGHKLLWVLDAPSAEKVRDMIYESGLSQWNDFEFYMASNLDEILAWTDKLQTLW
jgi:hypothetical protein